MFQQGDQVVIVYDGMLAHHGKIKPPVKKGETYTVKREFTCGCGHRHVDIGISSEYEYITCRKFHEELPEGDVIHWCHASRFQKVKK